MKNLVFENKGGRIRDIVGLCVFALSATVSVFLLLCSSNSTGKIMAGIVFVCGVLFSLTAFINVAHFKGLTPDIILTIDATTCTFSGFNANREPVNIIVDNSTVERIVVKGIPDFRKHGIKESVIIIKDSQHKKVNRIGLINNESYIMFPYSDEVLFGLQRFLPGIPTVYSKIDTPLDVGDI